MSLVIPVKCEVRHKLLVMVEVTELLMPFAKAKMHKPSFTEDVSSKKLLATNMAPAAIKSGRPNDDELTRN